MNELMIISHHREEWMVLVVQSETNQRERLQILVRNYKR